MIPRVRSLENQFFHFLFGDVFRVAGDIGKLPPTVISVWYKCMDRHRMEEHELRIPMACKADCEFQPI